MATQNLNTVSVEQGQAVQLSGDMDNASYTRDGLNLVLTQGLSTTVYENFFAQGEGNPLPDMILSDGSTVAAKDFLQAQNPDMDLTTAAGSISQATGSGGSYSDDAGQLIGGVDALGSLGTTTWGGREPGSFNVSAEPLFNNPGVPGLPEVPGAGGGPGPVDPQPSDGASGHLQVSKADASSSFSLDLKGLTGSALSPSDVVDFHFAPGTEDYFTQPTYQDGKLVVGLTPAGIAALQNGDDFSGSVFVTINGREYEILLDGAKNPDYQTPSESEMKAEWYESDGTLQNANVSLAGENTNTVNVGGMVKDSSVTLADSALGNVVTIEGDYTTYNTYQDYYGYNGQSEEVESDGFVGITGSIIDAGDNGVVNVNVSNTGAGHPGDSSQYVAGIAGYHDAETTVKGDEVNISAEMSTQHGSAVYNPNYGSYNQQAYGIDNRDSITNVTGRDITIEATGRADNMIDPNAEYWSTVNSPNVSVTGVRSGGLYEHDDEWNTIPQNVRSTVNISGKADTANSIHISANAVAPAGNDLDSFNLGATGVKAGTGDWSEAGDVNITGGSGNDTIVIEAFAEGVYGGGGDNGGVSLNATGLAVYGGNGAFEDDELFSKVNIDGGDGFDRLDISASTSSRNDTANEVHAGQSATGIDSSNGQLSIKNVEEINITATNKVGSGFADDYWSGPQAIGINASNSDISFVNDDQLKLSVKSDGQGVMSYNTDLKVHSGGDLNVDIDAVDGGINTYKPGGWVGGEAVKGTTSFTSDGDLTMKVSVSDASSAYSSNGPGKGAGIETTGGGASTLISSQGKMDLTVEVHTSDPAHQTYAIYTEGGNGVYDYSSGYYSVQYEQATLTIESHGEANITLVGDVYAVGGSNYITTYDGDDVISISGTIVSDAVHTYTGSGYEDHAGLNQIDTGAGNDTITVDGDLHAKYGDINISTGEGQDVLEISGDLKADADGKIDINMGSGDDLLILNGSNITGDVKLDGGIGDDTLVFKFDVADGVNSLTDALDAGKITGFDNLILDITNDTDETLSLGSILDSLYKGLDGGANSSSVYIKGDAGDSIDVGSGWSSGDTVSVGDTEYTTWTNGDDVIYIQSQVGIVG